MPQTTTFALASSELRLVECALRPIPPPDIGQGWAETLLIPVDRGQVTGCGYFGQVALADQGREVMGVFQVKAIVVAVEVGGHHPDETAAVLPFVGPAHLNPGNLGHRIGGVGLFRRPSHRYSSLIGCG